MNFLVNEKLNKKKNVIHISFIFFYFFSIWAIFLIISSVITFFHLQLGHTLTVVENWNFDQGWEISSLVKVFAFFLLVKFISIRSVSRKPLREFFITKFQLPNKELFVLIVFNLLFSILFLKPVVAERVSFEVSKLFSSYIGSFIYIFTDVLFLLFLQHIYPLSRKRRLVESTLFILLSYYLNLKVFTHSNYVNISLVYFLTICLGISYWRKSNWSFPFIFLILFVCPIVSFLGIDFIWGTEFSYLYPTTGVPIFILFISLLIVSICYMQFFRKTIAERDDQV
ncbi:hypothetical protein A9Q84_08415 [Halobacteriovorax marinus]|uniref:Uncharacterized protein n=1 Tax=Halobacteriovorax marinus TaxID=97084 RepID=A0A1Y5F643_9BACT|nr:hypothetical protein A9Q84_08415 [Halobacteriovorax marinus]